MAQSVLSDPLSIQRRMWICSVTPLKERKMIQDTNAAKNRNPVAIHCAVVSPTKRQPKPQRSEPISGAKSTVSSMLLTLHHVYVFNSDRATIAEEAYKDREANRGLGGGNGQDKQGKDLSDKITKE